MVNAIFVKPLKTESLYFDHCGGEKKQNDQNCRILVADVVKRLHGVVKASRGQCRVKCEDYTVEAEHFLASR